jgi:hypothetical protein
MVAKLKAKFIPKDYQDKSVQEVTESKIERFVGERVHRRVLQVEHKSRT